MRTVKARVYFSAEREWREITGKFHRWGDTFEVRRRQMITSSNCNFCSHNHQEIHYTGEEFRESPAMQFTMAIIELEDGKIMEAIPSNVQFID